MQGPHAFARTVAPIDSKSFKYPSRSIVALVCSEPGVTINGTFALRPYFAASLAIKAALPMSSYDEFVQDPINALEIFTGYSLSFASFFNPEIGLAKSGVCGPTI